jgi:curved DNA-binding protein CbpA
LNLYSILELQPTATPEEIKHSFRRLAKQYHPDVSDDPRAEDRFKLIYIAYEILSDGYKREIYDELQILKEADEMIRLRRWRRHAHRQAGHYANMEYEQFENTVLENLKFHTNQSIGFLFTFLLLCLGFAGVMVGTQFIQDAPDGAFFAGIFICAFSGAMLFTAGKAALDILKEW